MLYGEADGGAVEGEAGGAGVGEKNGGKPGICGNVLGSAVGKVEGIGGNALGIVKGGNGNAEPAGGAGAGPVAGGVPGRAGALGGGGAATGGARVSLSVARGFDCKITGAGGLAICTLGRGGTEPPGSIEGFRYRYPAAAPPATARSPSAASHFAHPRRRMLWVLWGREPRGTSIGISVASADGGGPASTGGTVVGTR